MNWYLFVVIARKYRMCLLCRYCFWTKWSKDVQFVLWMISQSILDRWESDHTPLSHALETIKCKMHLKLPLWTTRMCDPFHPLSWAPSSRSKVVGSKVTVIAISPHHSQMLFKEINTGTCSLCFKKMALKGPKHRMYKNSHQVSVWVFPSDGNVIYSVLGLHTALLFYKVNSSSLC